ncbi:MAG: branched-chain amino acid ABC transporter permease, partial [Deltaproteobacteria bacterium]|nr:branched-chain amino acid ABC transporter permease [Deltaproteobacteria bacterium]
PWRQLRSRAGRRDGLGVRGPRQHPQPAHWTRAPPTADGTRPTPGILRPRRSTSRDHSARFSTKSRFLLLALGLVWRIVHSPLGRNLVAIREDEDVARVAAKDVPGLKLTAFAVGCGIAAGAGALYAHYLRFVDPTSFTIMESVFALTIVIAGGAGTFWGPLAGAAVLVTLPEVLRFLDLPAAAAANVRQILYGGVLIAVLRWRPQGLLGRAIPGGQKGLRQ